MQIAGRVYPKSWLFPGASLISNADEGVEETPEAARYNRVDSERSVELVKFSYSQSRCFFLGGSERYVEFKKKMSYPKSRCFFLPVEAFIRRYMLTSSVLMSSYTWGSS